MRRTAAQLLGVVGGVALAAAAAASMTPKSGVVTHSTATAVRDTVSGCLQKGAKPGEYKLVEANGQSMTVKSSAVKLSPHVGHQVTVTTPSAPAAGDSTPAPVSKVSMVAMKCSSM